MDVFSPVSLHHSNSLVFRSARDSSRTFFRASSTASFAARIALVADQVISISSVIISTSPDRRRLMAEVDRLTRSPTW